MTPRRLLSPLVEWLSRTHLEERKFSVYAFYEAAINGRKQSGGNTFIRYERIVCPPIGLKGSGGERVVEEHSASVWISSLLLIDDHPLLGTFSPQKYRVSALWIFFSRWCGDTTMGATSGPLDGWIYAGKGE